jgi:hypothetical protein
MVVALQLQWYDHCDLGLSQCAFVMKLKPEKESEKFIKINEKQEHIFVKRLRIGLPQWIHCITQSMFTNVNNLPLHVHSYL